MLKCPGTVAVNLRYYNPIFHHNQGYHSFNSKKNANLLG